MLRRGKKRIIGLILISIILACGCIRMKVNLDCIPCFQRQILQALRFISDDEGLQEQVLRESMMKLLDLPWDSPPSELANEVHKVVRALTQVRDPYYQVKKESNDLALTLYPTIKTMIDESVNSLQAAIRMAIAGNIIDFGALREFNLEETIQKVSTMRFAVNDSEKLRERLQSAETLLFFTDNAGEIAFDRLLIETLLKEKRFKRIGLVVKGGPIINDATLDDALYLGLDKLPNVKFMTISNGEAGTGPQRSSQDVEDWIQAHDLVIAKGQSNYEGLSEFHELFFALIVKCPIVARDLHVAVGNIIFTYKP
jgi:uncharacterized protein with ATP-grasp and redox domains